METPNYGGYRTFTSNDGILRQNSRFQAQDFNNETTAETTHVPCTVEAPELNANSSFLLPSVPVINHLELPSAVETQQIHVADTLPVNTTDTSTTLEVFTTSEKIKKFISNFKNSKKRGWELQSKGDPNQLIDEGSILLKGFENYAEKGLNKKRKDNYCIDLTAILQYLNDKHMK